MTNDEQFLQDIRDGKACGLGHGPGECSDPECPTRTDQPRGYKRTGDVARNSLIDAIEADLDEWNEPEYAEQVQRGEL